MERDTLIYGILNNRGGKFFLSAHYCSLKYTGLNRFIPMAGIDTFSKENTVTVPLELIL